MVVAGVAVFIAIQMTIGLFVAKAVRGSSTRFIVVGRGLILPLAATALMAQAVDSNATLGNTDLSSQFGFWAGASLPIGLAICLFLTGLFFAKPLNSMGLLTLPDFYRRKYGRAVELVASPIMVLSFTILLAGNLVAGGYLFETFRGTSFTIGVLLIALAMLLYTLPGGLLSVVYTDLLQVSLAVIGSIAVLVFIAVNYGISIPKGMCPFDFGQLTSPASGAYINWATLIALGLGDIVALDFMERVFAARSPGTARRACFVGAIGTLVIGIPFSLVALSAGSIFKQLGVKPGGDAILYTLLQNTAPAILIIIVLSTIVAASLSTGTGAVLAMSCLCAQHPGRQEWRRGEPRRASAGDASPDGPDSALQHVHRPPHPADRHPANARLRRGARRTPRSVRIRDLLVEGKHAGCSRGDHYRLRDAIGAIHPRPDHLRRKEYSALHPEPHLLRLLRRRPDRVERARQPGLLCNCGARHPKLTRSRSPGNERERAG